jgi:uncharacterized protein (TIGR00251 family)
VDEPDQTLSLREAAGAVCFGVRVSPRASREQINGVHAGALKLSLTAAPVDGAANDALIALLARALHVPKRAVRITAGAQSRNKTVCVDGVSIDAVRQALAPAAKADKVPRGRTP